MIIGGLQKFSLLDYPEHLSAIIFTQGCNFRCHFCYNPMLVWPKQGGKSKYPSANNDGRRDYPGISEDSLFDFLQERQGKLDAIVITGGEPTIHKDLPEFVQRIKKLGYKVKLDTNGTCPEAIKDLLGQGLIDYIAMDIKNSHDKYDLSVGIQPDLSKISESVKIIMESGKPYEFRTTLVPHLHNMDDIKSMGSLIRGADKWYLQKFKSDIDLLNSTFEKTASFTDKEMEEFCVIGKGYVKECLIR